MDDFLKVFIKETLLPYTPFYRQSKNKVPVQELKPVLTTLLLVQAIPCLSRNRRKLPFKQTGIAHPPKPVHM